MILKTKTKTVTLSAPTRSIKRLVIEDSNPDLVIAALSAFTDVELETATLEEEDTENPEQNVVVDEDSYLTAHVIDFRQDQEESSTVATVLLTKKLHAVTQDVLDKAEAYDILMQTQQ